MRVHGGQAPIGAAGFNLPCVGARQERLQRRLERGDGRAVRRAAEQEDDVRLGSQRSLGLAVAGVPAAAVSDALERPAAPKGGVVRAQVPIAMGAARGKWVGYVCLCGWVWLIAVWLVEEGFAPGGCIGASTR